MNLDGDELYTKIILHDLQLLFDKFDLKSFRVTNVRFLFSYF
jgi:hypothetical protein